MKAQKRFCPNSRSGGSNQGEPCVVVAPNQDTKFLFSGTPRTTGPQNNEKQPKRTKTKNRKQPNNQRHRRALKKIDASMMSTCFWKRLLNRQIEDLARNQTSKKPQKRTARPLLRENHCGVQTAALPEAMRNLTPLMGDLSTSGFWCNKRWR